MMDCKKALVESDGDIDKAIDNLRKSGIAKAEKKVRETKGPSVLLHSWRKIRCIIELNWETDLLKDRRLYRTCSQSCYANCNN